LVVLFRVLNVTLVCGVATLWWAIVVVLASEATAVCAPRRASEAVSSLATASWPSLCVSWLCACVRVCLEPPRLVSESFVQPRDRTRGARAGQWAWYIRSQSTFFFALIVVVVLLLSSRVRGGVACVCGV